MSDLLQRGDTVTHPRFQGVALWFVELFEDNPTLATVVMVGDDHRFQVDADELQPVDRHDFCSCGQVGCGWD